eukprot:TRINITY_DN2453_c0_g1_i2.p1 TRINITY_DN2453_c0_g1~~TRINITY_DN2453_c0_g1_i2.p1  ORF type:complete len:363 (-),score=79.13 TRINITY_DN2453_c0_g1_i2:617-1705(-)
MDVTTAPLISATITATFGVSNLQKIRPIRQKKTGHGPNCFLNSSDKSLFRGFASKLKMPSVLVLPNLLRPVADAVALTYEEALQQGVSSGTSENSADVDVSSFADSVASFASENAVYIAAAVAAVGLRFLLNKVFFGPKSWGIVSAQEAYSKLEEEPGAQLVDIREQKDVRETGSPDIKALKKKAFQIAYNGEDESFLGKVSARFKDPENTTLYILDSFDGDSAKVAQFVSENGFKSAYAIKDGAEGPRGWQNSGLPWVVPRKAFNLDISGLTDALGNAIEDSSGLVPVTVGVAAATGVGVAAASEIETILQLLGSAALVQFFIKKLLFAEVCEKPLIERKLFNSSRNFLTLKLRLKSLSMS